MTRSDTVAPPETAVEAIRAAIRFLQQDLENAEIYHHDYNDIVDALDLILERLQEDDA
jgi:hypothetical protein